MLRVSLLACLVLLSFLPTSLPAQNPPHYAGRVEASWDADGRSMTLTKPFAYIDSKGQRWEAPAGSRVNGASIPNFAWPAVGGPFVRPYSASSADRKGVGWGRSVYISVD